MNSFEAANRLIIGSMQQGENLDTDKSSSDCEDEISNYQQKNFLWYYILGYDKTYSKVGE